jgi:hypothetical protein
MTWMKTFGFLIDSISVALLLRPNGTDDVLTQRYLGFLIFKAVLGDLELKLPKTKFAPNAIFRVGSYSYILYSI